MINYSEIIKSFWVAMDRQDWISVRGYFDDKAEIYWHNTNEIFNAQEFVQVNAEYPGDWGVSVERLECTGNIVITVAKIKLKDGDVSFHATSFFEFHNDKIMRLNEYWGEDGEAPQWRKDKKIGGQFTEHAV